MTIRTPIVVAACLGVLMGVAISSLAVVAGQTVSLRLAAILGCSGVGILVAAPARIRKLGGVFLVAVVVGIARFVIAPPDAPPSPVPERATVVIQGRVTRVAVVSGDRVRIRMTDATVRAAGRSHEQYTELVPDVEVVAMGDAGVRYGDTLEARCAWRAPVSPRDRLTLSGTCAAASTGDVRTVARGGGSPTLRALDALHHNLVRRARELLTPPASDIVLAMVLGERSELPETLLDAFRRTGTIHVLVVSGWHMTFVALALQAFLRALGMPRTSSRWAAILGILAFLGLVGGSPSAIRGALMAVAVLGVGAFGRLVNPLRILLIVATVMVLAHPYILGFDLGFQLSFAATAGILLAAPVLTTHRTQRRWVAELFGLLAASVAATLATAPLLIGAFGTFALLGPIVNLFVVPFVPLLMGGGALLLVLDALAPVFTSVLVAANDAVVQTLLRIVTVFAQVPGGVWVYRPLDGWFIAACYAFIALAVVQWCRRRSVPLLSPLSPFARAFHDGDRAS